MRLKIAALAAGLVAFAAAAVLLYGGNPPASTARAAAGHALTAAELAELDGLRRGEMQNLVLHDSPGPAIGAVFSDGEGAERRLSDFAGKVVLVNLWATWCPPCRAEMPSLDRLAGEMAGPGLAVLALSGDRGGPDRVRAFFDEVGVENLAVYMDGRDGVARAAGVVGLPVTLILDRQGREIARLTGDASWDSAEAKAFLSRLIELTAPEREA